MRDGPTLVAQLKSHVVAVMEGLDDCEPGQVGGRNVDIERAANLALDLDVQDHYLTWSILQALESDGKVEILRTPKRRYRLRLAGDSV